MNVYTVPLGAVPAQQVATQLGNQACLLNVYQKSTGLFLDLYVAGVAIITGVICESGAIMVPDGYNGFSGILVFADTQGDDDPYYTGLADRFLLFWIG